MTSALALAAALLLSGPEMESSYSLAQGWSATDTALEGSFAVAVALDWQQTRWVRAQGGHELNPVLGRHVSPGRLNTLAFAAVAGHAAVSAVLPPRWRAWWQGVTLVCELGVVGRNAYQIGALVRF